jgi:hypothetical protein
VLRNLPVGQPLGDKAGALKLLSRQVIDRARLPAASALAAGSELCAGRLCPPVRADVLENVERDPEMLACLPSLASTAQELAVRELCAGRLEGTPAGEMEAHGVLEMRTGVSPLDLSALQRAARASAWGEAVCSADSG